MTSEQVAADIFREASGSIEVLAPPYDEVVAEAAAQRRRRRRRVVGGGAALAVVLASLTWVSMRLPSGAEDLPPADVLRSPNPVDVAWYADGRLHLELVSVGMSRPAHLAEVSDGVVYDDREGQVVFVAADGARRLLGHKDPDSPLVAGGDWAAWVDPKDRPALVTYDVAADHTVGTVDVPPTGVRAVAIDQHRVYYETPDGSFGWDPVTGLVVELDRTDLLDIESGTRIYQQGDLIDMIQPFFSVEFVRRGVGAQASPGGFFVLTRSPGDDEGQPYRPLLYGVRSGERLPSGVAGGERVVDAAFGSHSSLTYLVLGAGEHDPDDPLLILRSCSLGSHLCSDVAPVQPGSEQPMLAH